MRSKIKYLALLFFMGSAITGIGQDAEKPNVLFIISDDLTTTAVSSYGNLAVKTPNIDLLASQGVKYTHAYTLSNLWPFPGLFDVWVLSQRHPDLWIRQWA